MRRKYRWGISKLDVEIAIGARERAFLKMQGLDNQLSKHPAILAVEDLLEAINNQYADLNLQEQFSLIKCFVDHPIEKTDLNYSDFNEILKLFVDHDQSDLVQTFYSIIFDLNKANLLTLENFNAFVTHENRHQLHNVLRNLASNEMMTQENFSAITNCRFEPAELACALWELNKAGRLTPENREAMLTVSNDFFDFVGLARAFNKLADAGILNSENRSLLKSLRNFHVSPSAIISLHRARILTDANRNVFAAFDVSRRGNLLPVIVALGSGDLLTQHNFNQLLAPECAILTNPGSHHVWDRIPQHLFTQDLLDQLFQWAQLNATLDIIIQNVNEHLRMHDRLAGNEAGNFVPNEDQQSTHTKSVHKTVSESAVRLKNTYGNILTEKGIETILKQIKEWLRSVSENLKNESAMKNNAAKKCIERISKSAHVDKVSKVGTTELVALTWLAIHDELTRISSLADARQLWVEGLYEIQRGYNLSAEGKDDGAKDRPICEGGTFNKLIEKLQGVHPHAEIVYLTIGYATEKLQCVTKEEAKCYLSEISEEEFYLILSELSEYGVKAVLDKIKEKVASRIFEEFGSIFKGDEHSDEFIEFIAGMKYVDLGDLNTLRLRCPRASISNNEMSFFFTDPDKAMHKEGEVCLWIKKNESGKTFPYYLYSERNGVRVVNSRMDFSLSTRDALFKAMQGGTSELIELLSPKGETASENAALLRNELDKNQRPLPEK